MLKEPESMAECNFFSRRVLKDGTKLLAWVPKGTNVMNVKYTCGSCKKRGEITQGFQKPTRFNCQNCGIDIFIEPLKGKKGRGKKKKV